MRFTSFVLIGIACIVGAVLFRDQTQATSTLEPHTERELAESISSDYQGPAVGANPAREPPVHAVIVHKPAGPPTVRLASVDPQQRLAEVACSTCHSVRPPNLENRLSTALDEFHQGLEFSHGELACYACHNPSNADTLRLADGSAVEYAEVLTLCTQCHSKQAESFAHGAHGGMNGFWDLSRGPQSKNNCIDCHDPHAPTYPQMTVTFKPKDRFNSAEDSHAHQK